MSRTVYLDARKLKEKQEAHDYLARMLSLPAYYGRNLDALYDCLTDMKDCRVVLLHHKKATLSGTYGAKIVKVLEEGARNNTGFGLSGNEVV